MSGWKLTRNLLGLLAVALVLAGIGLVANFSRHRGDEVKPIVSSDTSGCQACHGNPQYQPKTGRRSGQDLYVDQAVLTSSVHGSIECADCHSRGDHAGQRIEAEAVQALCGGCHTQERTLQESSVHSDPKVTTCLDCHSPGGSGHDVAAVHTTASPVFVKNVAQTCSRCHADEQLMARYDLNADVYATYMDSPHGKVMKLTDADLDGLNPATCTTCHGSHDVKETDDPAAPVSSTASLARLCATCHPGANENFARGLAAHKEFSAKKSPAPYYGERFFFVLTASVVSLGLLMVGLEGFHWLSGPKDGPGNGSSPGGRGPSSGGGGQGKPGGSGHQVNAAIISPPPTVARARPAGRLPTKEPISDEILRFDIHQRLQHFVMMASFLVLAFTGLPQKFPDWEVSQWLIGMWGGVDTARTIHRFAGLVMLTDCLYHLGYVAYNTLVLKKPAPVWMIPTLRDVADFYQDLQYWFGRSSERPRFGRFSYREKFDYWAIFWGMPVMAASGLTLMFPTVASKFLPGDAIPVALVSHSDEAVLAVLWIFIVHMFFVHLNPRFFPLNRAIFTGKMPRHVYAQEHPLELASLNARHRPRARPVGNHIRLWFGRR